MPTRVTFPTGDGVAIVGAYAEGRSGAPAALLLHMMPATKESWDRFAEKLSARGFATLAIDLRGHGESVAAEDDRAMGLDVEAAMRWLADRGHDPKRTVIVGASIGANLAIGYAAAHHEIPAVGTLSPGLDYHGITTENEVAAMAPSQALLLAASDEDQYSFMTIHALAKRKPDATLRELRGAGHGTAMFERDPGFMEEAITWLAENVK